MVSCWPVLATHLVVALSLAWMFLSLRLPLEFMLLTVSLPLPSSGPSKHLATTKRVLEMSDSPEPTWQHGSPGRLPHLTQGPQGAQGLCRACWSLALCLDRPAGALVLLATPRRQGRPPGPVLPCTLFPSLADVVAAGWPPLHRGNHRDREGTPITGRGKSKG